MVPMNKQMLGIIDAAVNQHSLQDLTAGVRSEPFHLQEGTG